MKWIIHLLILSFWSLLGAGAGWMAYQKLPNKFQSEGEVALNSESLSSSGLAQFARTTLSSSVERELASQLFDSSEVRQHAAKKVGGITPMQVRESVSIKSTDNSPIIKIKASADSPQRAVDIIDAMIEKAVEIDAQKRAKLASEALDAVQKRLAEVGSELAEVLEKIRAHTISKGVMLSNEAERQQTLAMTLADNEARLSTLLTEQASLKNRLNQSRAVVSAFAAKGSLPASLETEGAERGDSLADTRRKLLEQEAQLASAQARYGLENATVLAARAQVEVLRKSIAELLEAQQIRLQNRLSDNEEAVKIIREKIANTERNARDTDLTLDPVFTTLKSRRDSLQATQAGLLNRLTELTVYNNAKSNSIHRFSAPKLPDGPSTLLLLITVGSGLMLGGLLGLVHSVLKSGLLRRIFD